jgi:hypothetical protein
MIFFNTVVMVVGGLILSAALFSWIYMAWTGRDLVMFNELKTNNPKQYLRLRAVGRTNGFLVMLMCIFGMLASPAAALDPQGGILLAVLMFLGSCLFFWLSWRWFWWAVHAPRPIDKNSR